MTAGSNDGRKRSMAARILIVEDEEPLTLLLSYNLEAEAFEVVCSGGESGVLVVTETQDDLSHALLHGRSCAFCMPVSMATPPALLPVVPAATLPVAEPVATLPASVPARFPAHRLARAPPVSRLL